MHSVPPSPVDLTNCDVEPIHIPGSIQPHGAMLVCDPVGTIEHASANAQVVIGCAEPPIGRMLADIVGDDTAHDLRNEATKSGGAHVAGVLLAQHLPGAPGPLDIAIHHYKDRMFVEFEPASDDTVRAPSAIDLTQGLIRRISLESDVRAIATVGARLARTMLGYDRVMVYQFLHNGAGHVIAEAKRSDLTSFMGQHFPAGDIPYQARRLYLLNPIRVIADATYAPSPILPPVRASEPPIDMSFAALRSVSPIHCEYLQNMGVAASMSMSIVVDGELWGLIACHHDTPKRLGMATRIGAELFAQYLSLQIAVAERRAEVVATQAAREKLDEIVAGHRHDEPVADALSRNLEDLSDLLGADGAGLLIDGRWSSAGAVPRDEDLDAVMALVARAVSGTSWATSELKTMMGPDSGFGDSVAGLLAIPISSLPRDYLLLFRSEEAHKIEWAGEPVKHIVPGPSGDRLTPRGSFETWREEVRGKSRPWTTAELAVAEATRTYLRDVVLHHTEVTAEDRLRADKRRRILNDELNHRVKNIIALVKSIALQTGAHAASVEDYSISLEGRLRALAFAHDQSLAGTSGDLTALLDAEASLHRYGSSPDRVTIAGAPVGLDDRTFGVMALVVHELMTNAAKYGALSVPEGTLTIAWALTAEGDCRIEWTERGGPVVTKPARTGFGSKLVHTTMSYDLGGSIDIRFVSAGLTATLVIPAAHITEAAPRPHTPASSELAVHALHELDVLLVEDQALIAMDTEEALVRLGARRVRTLPNVADAQAAIADMVPDCAVLDFNLGDDTATDIADTLARHGVPFVFATGYGDSVMIPDRFRDVPVVRKPVSRAVLAAGLDLALAQRAADEDEAE
jgi:light-regulated signal transduction histidine kinase (bacteriophytochrome)